jgi:hypothetical protein
LSEEELKKLFDLWQMSMINCCDFELTFLPQKKRCHTFVVEHTHMLCGGHPDWDPKMPGKNVFFRQKSGNDSAQPF